MKKQIALLLSITLALISFGGISYASYMANFSGSGFGDGGTGDPQPVSFDGYVELTVDPTGKTGNLKFFLENTSLESNEGALTSLAFMLPEGIFLNGGYSFESGFDYLLTSPKAPPFTTAEGLTYDAGAGTRKLWTGGSSRKGISTDPTDNSGTFNFGISSANTITNFTDMLVSNEDFIAVRFQGFTDESSAKIGGGGGGAQVPEPATIFLLGSGLLGLFGYRKKFWKPKN